MKRENRIRPTLPGENLVRTRFTLDIPADPQKRGENALCFS
jgi:hypothetical protein